MIQATDLLKKPLFPKKKGLLDSSDSGNCSADHDVDMCHICKLTATSLNQSELRKALPELSCAGFGFGENFRLQELLGQFSDQQ